MATEKQKQAALMAIRQKIDIADRVGLVATAQNWRDLSIVLEEKHGWAEMERSFSGVQDLASARLIDVYKGKNIPAGFRSITIRFTFTSMTGTLNDADVGARMAAVLEKLIKNFSAKLRS